MIKTLTVWHGNHPMLYSSEIDEWVAEHSQAIDYASLDASELPIRGKGVDVMDQNFIAGSSLFADDKNMLIRNAQEVVHAAKSPILTSIIEHFDTFDNDVNLAIEFNTKNKIPKNIFDRADIVSYHVVDNESDINGSREWMVGYFQDNGIKISASDARKVLDYCGNDTESLVSSVLSIVAKSGGEKSTVTAQELTKEIGSMGSRGPFELSNAVFSGNRKMAAEVFHRDPDNLFPALGMIRNKLSVLIFIKCRKNKVELGDMGVNSQWYLNQLKKDAEKASLDGLLYAMSRSLEADYALKGGVHPELVSDEFQRYIDDVTQVFQRSSKKRTS